MTDNQLRLTRPDELPAPRLDDGSVAVLDEAVETLARMRTPYWLGDTGVRLHALASLLAQAQQLLPDAVAQARDQELTWDEIGELLGLTGPNRRTPLPRQHPHTHKDLTMPRPTVSRTNTTAQDVRHNADERDYLANGVSGGFH